MKNKLIILLLLFAGSLQANAQKDDYIHLLDTGKLWIEAMAMEFGEIFVYENYIGERIVYNDTVYYELFTGFKSPYYLREDTIERKVYSSGYSYEDNQEGLIYDFSLEIGDSISYPYNPDLYFKLEIKQIETILGTNRNVFYLRRTWDNSLPYVIWIEGIGSLAGIFEFKRAPSAFLTWVDPFELNCLYQNDELLYQSDWASNYGCHFEHLSIKEQDTQGISLFPNPTTGIFTVETDRRAVLFTITDITGKEIYHSKDAINSVSTGFWVNITNQAAGIYFLSIQFQLNDQIQIVTKKIVKY